MPPTMLISSLEGVRRKVKLLGVAYGAGIVIAVAVIGLLLATILDYLLNLPSAPRLFLALIALTAIGYVLWRYVISPASKRISLSDIAGKLEGAFPQFDDRLRSTVNFVSGREVPGSEVMKERVVTETTTMASQLDLGRAVVATPAWYSMALGCGALFLLLMLGFWVVSPTYRDIALARLFMPFADQPWPKRVRIDLVSQVPQRLPVGQRLDVRMRLGKGDRDSMRAIVYYQYDDGPPMQEFMIRGADGTYSASLDTRVETGKAASNLKVWMKAGDDEKHLTAVTVVPRLSIRSVEAIVTPPPYVPQQQPMTVNLTAAPAVMAVGSKVAVRVNFNKPLAEGVEPVLEPVKEADSAAAAPNIAWAREGQLVAVGTLTADRSLRFHIRATDVDKFTNSALEEYELIVRPDQMPSVQIENPRRSEERTPVAVIPLQGLAEDDYGIKTLKLIVDRINDKKHWEIDLVRDGNNVSPDEISWVRAESSGDRLRFRANYNWDLAKLAQANLKSGDVLEYCLQVTDNYLLNGQAHDPVSSGKLRINIISQDELTNRIIEELRNAKDQIGNVKSAQTRTQQQTGDLANDTKEKKDLDAADKAAADRIANQQSTATSQTKNLAGRMDAIEKKLAENKSPSQDLKDLARDVKNDLNRAAEGPMKDAGQQLNQSQQPGQSPDQRNKNMEDAQQNQGKAADQLQQAMDRMANIGTLAQTIERINQILEDQKKVSNDTQQAGKNNLGKKPDEMKPEDKAKLEKAAEDQAKLAERTAKALSDMEKMAEQMAKSDPSAADAMKKAGETAKQQQVQPKQQKASGQIKENQQSTAQSTQKQVELGLEMMLNELREAERARLAELSKKLEELQKQIANLIRRQASHNLDNLNLQGPDAVAKIAAEKISDLMNKAERDPAAAAPKVELAQLGNSQEQTENNTRDIAKSAENMPNGAEPASHLLRAAGKMERAIFALRDKKLPAAYDPPQVEALAALEQAKKIVDEQKKNVDDKIGENDRETVRQKYVKIKGEQEDLNKETTRIDQARDRAGQLNRGETIKLGQLPGQQGKLADEVAKIDKDLAAVGSIVYIWSNKDIVKSMNGVKDELGQSTTGKPTQDQQKRIVAQLDAMIRNLSTNPKQSKFAQDGGGGQGNGGGSKLPTEAELKLLKDLQINVNDDTKVTDAKQQQNKQKDKETLLALGTRQGELRSLLDQLLQRASRGEVKLGPEPDKLSQLPEEAGEEDVENQEMDKALLNDKADAEKDEKQAMLIGDRMARSRQRLALNDDPGKVTQLIQQRIVKDLDDLIDQAREQQAQSRNSDPNQGKNGQKMPKPGDQAQQPDNQGKANPQVGVVSKPNSSSPADRDLAPGQVARQQDLNRQIKEDNREWGNISPRIRDAIIQQADDQVLEDYRKLVEDYWQSLSAKKEK